MPRSMFMLLSLSALLVASGCTDLQAPPQGSGATAQATPPPTGSAKANPNGAFYELLDIPEGKQLIVHEQGGGVVSSLKLKTKTLPKDEGLQLLGEEGKMFSIQYEFDNTVTPVKFQLSVRLNNAPLPIR